MLSFEEVDRSSSFPFMVQILFVWFWDWFKKMLLFQILLFNCSAVQLSGNLSYVVNSNASLWLQYMPSSVDDVYYETIKVSYC